MDNVTKRNIMARELWLKFFNSYLLEKKMITNEEHNKMNNMIAIDSDKRRKPQHREL